jgi:hypothetical protein
VRRPANKKLERRSSTIRLLEDYQANTLTKGIRKCTKDGKSGIEPFFRAVTIGMRSNEFLKMTLLVKDSENVGGRLARFEFACELMGEKVILGLLLIIL